MWVRLQSTQYISDRGKQLMKFPGEWVNVGKQQAMSWLATGEADRPDMPDLQALPGCGVVLLGSPATKPPGGLERVSSDEPRLEFARTLIWSGVNFRGDLLGIGFSLLDTWELAVPLLSYETLARDLGDESERERTRAVIRDLRVPVYDVRLMFLRRCHATRELLDEWAGEAGDRTLAFARALYRVKPLVLALPATWVLP